MSIRTGGIFSLPLHLTCTLHRSRRLAQRQVGRTERPGAPGRNRASRDSLHLASRKKTPDPKVSGRCQLRAEACSLPGPHFYPELPSTQQQAWLPIIAFCSPQPGSTWELWAWQSLDSHPSTAAHCPGSSFAQEAWELFQGAPSFTSACVSQEGHKLFQVRMHGTFIFTSQGWPWALVQKGWPTDIKFYERSAVSLHKVFGRQ